MFDIHKAGMIGLPYGEEIVTIFIALSRFDAVLDRQTDRQTNSYINIAPQRCCADAPLVHRCHGYRKIRQEVKVIWQKAPHGGPIPRLGVTPGGRKLYHWIPGVGFPISVP